MQMLGDVYIRQSPIDGSQSQVWWPFRKTRNSYISVNAKIDYLAEPVVFEVIYALKQQPASFKIQEGSANLEWAETLRRTDEVRKWTNLGSGLDYIRYIQYRNASIQKPLAEILNKELKFDQNPVLIVDPNFDYVKSNIQGQTNPIWL